MVEILRGFEMPFCSSCGTQIVQGSSFCGACGTPASTGTFGGSPPDGAPSFTPRPPSTPWRFTSIGSAPTVSWILFFAAAVLEAISFVCKWGVTLKIPAIVSMAAAITVVVGLGIAFNSMRAAGQFLSALLFIIGFGLIALSNLGAFISWTYSGYGLWNTAAFFEAIGGLTTAAGIFFLIFRPAMA